jgi:hypothetical protein
LRYSHPARWSNDRRAQQFVMQQFVMQQFVMQQFVITRRTKVGVTE